MNIDDRVMTPVGSGTVIGWYMKGARKRVTVAIDGGGDEPEQTFDEGQLTLLVAP
ncbi:hypothetical protein [Sphingomonas sanguinis]|uniref:hypothetical protein n=1 Tax=Sphingomonas sanguinis TaxID=33051 RepID=UPI00301B218A